MPLIIFVWTTEFISVEAKPCCCKTFFLYLSASINGVSLSVLPYWDITFFRLIYFQYWNSRHIGFFIESLPFWNVRYIEMTAILMGGHIVFRSYCNLFSKRYLFCLVILSLMITVNLCRSDNTLTWIAYFIISVMWCSSFKTCIVNALVFVYIYRLGIVLSFDLWVDGKTSWWLLKDLYSILVFVTGANGALVISGVARIRTRLRPSATRKGMLG